MPNDGAQRVSLHALIICSAGKKHRRQRRITASADGTRAALSLARGGSACPRSGSSENRLDDLFGKSARTFCRYLHRGPFRTCPILSHDLSGLSREAGRSGRSPAPKGVTDVCSSRLIGLIAAVAADKKHGLAYRDAGVLPGLSSTHYGRRDSRNGRYGKSTRFVADQSGLAPENFTTFAHFSVSSAMSFSN